MKKFFLKNEAGEQGPYSLEELKDKGITAETQIRYEDQDNWAPAGQLDELKELLAPAIVTAPPVTNVEETVAAAAPIVETVAVPAPVPAPAAATAAAAPVVKPPRKKGNPVITWALSLAVLGGTGYYVYQDMEKNKDATTATELTETTTTDPATDKEANDATTTNETNTVNVATDPATEDTAAVTTTPTTADPVVTTTTTPDNTDAVNKAEEDKKKLAALALAKKKEEEKKKQLAAEAKKKEEEKKKLLAAQALAAKEMGMRNNWTRYVTIGSYQIEGDDKVKPFSIPVNNGFSTAVDKVTLRVDYLKKQKIVHTETLTIFNIPAKSGSSVQAAGNKKGHTANVYITGASSRGLDFCYPSTGGKSGDPYYCN